MDLWSFVTFWDYVKDIAKQNGVVVSCDAVTSLNMIKFRVRSRQTMKGTAFCITKFDLDNLAEPEKMLTEKLLDMIKEVKE